MERVTFKDANGNWVASCTTFEGWGKLKYPAHIKGVAIDKLAAYEETGLDPKTLKCLLEEIKKNLEKTIEKIPKIEPLYRNKNGIPVFPNEDA